MNPDHRDDDRRITYFAATHTRGKREMFGIRAIDRGKHVYVIGKTGMGKSTMLENMAIQDIQNGEGIAFIDPHGSTAEKLLDFVPHDRIKDVVYFAPFDIDHPIGFNVMEDVGYDKRHLVVSGLMGAFKRIWVDAWSARMEYILQNTLLALLEYPGSTLLDVNRMLTNKNFRDAVIEKITDPIVKSFWTEEFAGFTDTYTREATPAIQNKIGQFTANPLIRNIVGQATSSFDIRKMMDEKKIFIVNLSKGRMGETNASLLGSMLTVKIYLAAMSRADEPASVMRRLPRFYFYVDEFQSMMNEAFADILSESRKYKLALTLANQYVEQMEENVRDAVFGNVGTMITFRVGPFDAETLKTMFEPTFTAEDLIGLGLGEIYLTLMIDGVGSAPFSAQTIPPIEAPNISYREDVVTQSRLAYGRARTQVEAAVAARQADFPPPPPKAAKKTTFKPYNGNGPSYSNDRSDRNDRNDRPEPARQERSPAEVIRAQQPVVSASNTTPMPVPIAAPVARPVVYAQVSQASPAVSPIDQRSALRAALGAAVQRPARQPIQHSAQPTVQQSVSPRSPAEILRSRLPQRPLNPSPATARVPEPKPAFIPRVHIDVRAPKEALRQESAAVKPSQLQKERSREEVPHAKSPEPSDLAAGPRADEVSNELLRRVLRDESSAPEE